MAEKKRASRDVTELRFDAGSLSLNLVASVGRRFGQPVERLLSTERLQEWLAGVGLDATMAMTDIDLDRVRRLREQLDLLFRTLLAGARPPVSALDEINAAAARCAPQLSTTRGALRLARPVSHGGVDPLLALIAADAIRIVVGADRFDLRVCAADDCRMLYLAHGRRARRWCSSERCGNRSRVAAHRARPATLGQRRPGT